MTGESSNIAEAAGKAGKAEPRARSSIEFPYTALDDAELIAKGVRDVGATSCEWDQLAAHLNFAANGGGFRLRMIGAKVFGLVTYERGRVELTDTGLRIVDPKFARAARVDSFLSVPLYKSAFDKLKGQTLPPVAAIERLLESLGVAPKQKDKARQAFMRSAKHAGFMEIAQDRLATPANIGASATDAAEAASQDFGEDRRGNNGNGGGGGGDPPQLHHFILGLLGKLPTPETDWATKDRIKWLQTAANIFDLIYTHGDDEAAIEVKIKKGEHS
jgi:hypothetical protein